MSETIINISVPTDNDGFITLQCPFCGDKFKLRAEEIEADELTHIFCPYCGLQDESSHFWTDEVMEQAKIAAVKSIINDGGKFLKGSRKPLKMEDDKILFETEDLEVAEVTCCQSMIKVRPLAKSVGIYCPFCGFN